MRTVYDFMTQEGKDLYHGNPKLKTYYMPMAGTYEFNNAEYTKEKANINEFLAKPQYKDWVCENLMDNFWVLYNPKDFE